MFSILTLSMIFSKFNKASIHHQFSRTYPWIEIQDLVSNVVISSAKRARKGNSFITSFVHSNTTSWILSAISQPKLSNQCFLGMFLTLKKQHKSLKDYQCMTFRQKIKQNNMGLFLFPNSPQIQSMNQIVMKIGSIQGFIFFWCIELVKYVHNIS